MELLVMVGVLALLGAVALRFGHDSRETPYSKEAELASLGLVLDQPTPPPTRVNAVRSGVRLSLRLRKILDRVPPRTQRSTEAGT